MFSMSWVGKPPHNCCPASDDDREDDKKDERKQAEGYYYGRPMDMMEVRRPPASQMAYPVVAIDDFSHQLYVFGAKFIIKKQFFFIFRRTLR
jgi:hypothetical protein